jgi:hypothetical protein
MLSVSESVDTESENDSVMIHEIGSRNINGYIINIYYYYSNWSKELDHVELTGAETWSDFSDQAIVVMINLLYTPILNEIMSKFMFSR